MFSFASSFVVLALDGYSLVRWQGTFESRQQIQEEQLCVSLILRPTAQTL